MWAMRLPWGRPVSLTSLTLGKTEQHKFNIDTCIFVALRNPWAFLTEHVIHGPFWDPSSCSFDPSFRGYDLCSSCLTCPIQRMTSEEASSFDAHANYEDFQHVRNINRVATTEHASL